MTIEQEAEKYAVDVELPDFDLWDIAAIVEKLLEQAYIAGSTARSQEAKDFAEWLPRHAQPKSINKNWILLKDGKEYTTEQLFDIFKSKPNG